MRSEGGSNDLVVAEAISRAHYLNRSLCLALGEADGAAVELASLQQIDWSAVREAMEALEHLISEDDVRADSVLKDSQALLQTALGKRFDAIARHLSHYDFESALQVLDEARSQLPPSTPSND